MAIGSPRAAVAALTTGPRKRSSNRSPPTLSSNSNVLPRTVPSLGGNQLAAGTLQEHKPLMLHKGMVTHLVPGPKPLPFTLPFVKGAAIQNRCRTTRTSKPPMTPFHGIRRTSPWARGSAACHTVQLRTL